MSDHTDRRLIEEAIAAQEGLRNTLGDDIVDVTIKALRSRLSPTAAPEASTEHERRLVTVLFLDVVDSTRILRAIDPEETMAIMDSALRALAGPVEACGGKVTRYMGDGFLAVFGLRRTRENDAEMAVRAGLGILDAAASVSDDVARTHHIDRFEVRIGINTGLVVTGGLSDAAGPVMGSEVNLAARIESAAPPGRLLISQSTYRQVRGRFDLEPAGSIEAKGFPEPVPVHLVLGERLDVPAGANRGIDDIETEMIGRREELRALRRMLEEVLATGNAHTATVEGEAGIGKSRLLSEFESSIFLESPATVFRARGTLESAYVPHSLLRDLIERHLGIRGDDQTAVAWEKLVAGLGAHFSAGPTRAAKIEAVGRLLGYNLSGGVPPDGVADNPQQLHDRAVAHLIEFFSSVAASGLMLVLLDDLQWADESSVAVLKEIIEELASAAILTVTLSRPGFRDTHVEWEQLPNHRCLELEPLSNLESELLIDSILSRIEDCPPELRTRLLEHAGGNPYFLEELVMMCIDDGVIVADGPVWSVYMNRLATLKVPTTLTGVIRARLDSLPAREHTLLQQAAVVGTVFWDGVIAEITGETGTDSIMPLLDSLQARQMIRRRDTSDFFPASEYAFTHTLLRDATYEEVLLGNRRHYHGIVADWLIARSGDREHEYVGLIAGHLERADRPTEALEYLVRAGEAAWNSYAITTASDFYDRALALIPDDDLEQRYQLLLNRVRTSGLKGNRDEQRRGLDELERITQEIGDRTKQSLVAVERTYLSFYTGDYPAALASARLAAERAEATSDLGLQSQTKTALAWAYLYLEDLAAARHHGERALELARQAERGRREATALNLLGMVALTAGELSEARTRLSRALELARLKGDRDAEVSYLNNLGVALTTLGEFKAAHEHFSGILRRAVEGGDRSGESTAHVNLAWVASARGAWGDARRHAEWGITMKRRQEHREAEAEALLWLGHAHLGVGEIDEAEHAYRASAAIRSELGQTALGLEAEAGLARIALARGDIGGAMSLAEGLLRHLDKDENLEGTWEPLRTHLTVVETLRVAGDDRSEQALNRAYRLLRNRAERIADPADRRSYLEEIPWHRRIEELAGSHTN